MNASDPGNSIIVDTFDRPEDLPVCSKSRAGGMALVGESFYVCFAKKWRKVDNVVEDICNIPACTDALEGKLFSTKTDKVIYQCKSGSWRDRDGIGFLDDEYIKCFMGTLVRDSVESEDDLTICSGTRAGSLVVVSGQIKACVPRKWVDVEGVVVAETDLPPCGKDGERFYVASKMATYTCDKGIWYGEGEPQDSTEIQSSASSEEEDFASSSSVAYQEDSVKVRGVCIASEKEVEKGNPVVFSFHNMGGTPRTYSWILPDNSAFEDSNAITPTISFSRGGSYSVQLVVNEGMGSESDTINCSRVEVSGVPVQGCSCHTDAETLIIRNGRPVQAEWAVEGCTGEPPFTYEWENGATGNENVATGETVLPGLYAPSVTVYNSDGETMSPTCTSVAVTESPKASCSIRNSTSGYVFSVSNISGISDQIGSVTMALESASEDVNTPVTIAASYDEWYGSYMWSWTSKTISLDGMAVPYSVYALLFEGDTICTASMATCEVQKQNAYIGDTVSWNFKVDGTISLANTYRWTFTDEDGELIAVSRMPTPSLIPSKEGKVKASLVVDEGMASENVLTCSEAYVIEKGAYIVVDEFRNYAQGELASGNYVVNGCSDSYGSGTTWYIYTSPTKVATWISSSVSVESDWGNGGMLYVTYPVYISIPEGESLIVSDCW